MVVVSGSWVKNVVKCPTPKKNRDMVITPQFRIMYPKAILICRQNSHHFHERTLTIDQPIKIGRSVARAKPTSTNAIFDCKVLSRHHALLWYENGKFYLQDTKSSNGTFVNNNRLSAETENHELSSGDIVQFGVDVVENNRKVTHGCIVATLKLFLPDGKEAKASPSISEGDRQGNVALDDLYKLNQIIQEAKQREQCLETKLTALQKVIDDTRKSAEESWQAYVGEERLLSRVSALENQLQQASKNWSEDKLREELAKLQAQNESYQTAAKEALEKLHAERLEAVALATEQERARISAEQDVLLAREQVAHAQLELEEVALKLTEERQKLEDERKRIEKKEEELEEKMDSDAVKIVELQLKLHQLSAAQKQLEDKEKQNLILNEDDVKTKEEMLMEDESENTDINSNGVQNHINLNVKPLENDIVEEDECLEKNDNMETNANISEKPEKEEKHVSFMLADDNDSQNGSDETVIENEELITSEKGDYVDSKTLKYQYQSAQNEMRRKIELLESLATINKGKLAELEKDLNEKKALCQTRLNENEDLKNELVLMRQKYQESCNESQQLKDKMEMLARRLEEAQDKLKETNKNNKEKIPEKELQVNNNLVPLQQLVNVEEELVRLKERFARVGEEKLKLQHDLLNLTEQYKIVCNQTYNKHFFYIAPLVIMVLYLLVSAMIS